MDTTEAADLARIILEDSEGDRPTDLYTLNVGEARTLARAALAADRVEALVDILERESDGRGKFDSVLAYHASEVKARTADRIRAALKGGDA